MFLTLTMPRKEVSTPESTAVYVWAFNLRKNPPLPLLSNLLHLLLLGPLALPLRARGALAMRNLGFPLLLPVLMLPVPLGSSLVGVADRMVSLLLLLRRIRAVLPAPDALGAILAICARE